MKSRKVIDIVFDLLEKDNELLYIKKSIKNFEDFKNAVQVFYLHHVPRCSKKHEVEFLVLFLLKEKKFNCYENEINFKEFVDTISLLFFDDKEQNVFLRPFERHLQFISIIFAISAIIVSIINYCVDL